MYDFLDKIGLKTVLEAIKAKFPTSLPADGGNADYATNAGNSNTIAGKPIDNIFHSKTINAVADIDNTDGNWSTDFVTAWSQIAGTFPDGVYNRWFSVRQYQTSATKDFKIQFLQTIESLPRMWHRCQQPQGGWTNWREISTNPVKSVQVVGTTDNVGNFILWNSSENRKPVFITFADRYVIPFLSSTGNYYAHVLSASTDEQLTNTAITTTVFYIEI